MESLSPAQTTLFKKHRLDCLNNPKLELILSSSMSLPLTCSNFYLQTLSVSHSRLLSQGYQSPPLLSCVACPSGELNPWPLHLAVHASVHLCCWCADSLSVRFVLSVFFPLTFQHLTLLQELHLIFFALHVNIIIVLLIVTECQLSLGTRLVLFISPISSVDDAF